MTTPRLRLALAATLALTLTGGSLAALPDTTDTPPSTPVAASLNPLAPQAAEAAWWHVSVIQWRSICGYGRTTYLGHGLYSHEVKRWATTVYSSSTCILSGERMTNRHPRPWWGMTGTIYGTPAWT